MQPLCAFCGKPISGKYIQDYWQNSYCAVHLKSIPQCDYCGRFIGSDSTQGGKMYQDGRKICGLCLKKAVSDPQEGRRVLNKVHGLLEASGIDIQPFNPDFALIKRSKLKELVKGGEKQGFATYHRQMRNKKIISFKMEIFILDGLPETHFAAACAHELMHIWFYSRNIIDASPALIEGSCNMAAYLVLIQKKTPEAEYLIKSLFADRSRHYGIGFRKVHKLVHKIGIQGWLQYVVKHKRL